MNTEKTNRPLCIDVALGARSYPIYIGANLLQNAHIYIKPVLKGRRVAIICDEQVAPLYLAELRAGLRACAAHIDEIILPVGEEQKSFSTLEKVLGILLEKNYSRDDCLVAFGGGVVGDITGFCASIMKRGCQFIQIPTTLLAQVDSAVGGKTAINTSAGKNLVGSFYQPRLVLSDTQVLQSLPARQIKAGYSEILKYALIGNVEFFVWLEENVVDLFAHKPDIMVQAIAVSCQMKADIVGSDEHEKGARALLNLGHSFAHALEGVMGYNGDLLHGEAVSVGLMMAFEYAGAYFGGKPSDCQRLRTHLQKIGMPCFADLPPQITANPDILLPYMLRDKKNTSNKITLILPRAIGDSFIEKNVDTATVKAFLATYAQEIPVQEKPVV